MGYLWDGLGNPKRCCEILLEHGGISRWVLDGRGRQRWTLCLILDMMRYGPCFTMLDSINPCALSSHVKYHCIF